MTRKDYKVLAEALARYFNLRDSHPEDVFTLVAQALAKDNPNFDPARFIKACYGN